MRVWAYEKTCRGSDYIDLPLRKFARIGVTITNRVPSILVARSIKNSLIYTAAPALGKSTMTTQGALTGS